MNIKECSRRKAYCDENGVSWKEFVLTYIDIRWNELDKMSQTKQFCNAMFRSGSTRREACEQDFLVVEEDSVNSSLPGQGSMQIKKWRSSPTRELMHSIRITRAAHFKTKWILFVYDRF